MAVFFCQIRAHFMLYALYAYAIIEVVYGGPHCETFL